MGFAAEIIDRAENLLAIGLFGAIGVVIIPKNLAYLIHQLDAGIRPEFLRSFLLTFHTLSYNIAIYGTFPEEMQYVERILLIFPRLKLNTRICGNSVHP